jgi:hypothetical protein
MIDMGHSLPAKLLKSIISKAKEKNKDFVFWEENFTLTEKSKRIGYSAVVGYLCFDEHIAWKMHSLLNMLENVNTPIPFFATPENHNTPRAASRFNNTKFSEMCWALNCFIPGLPFIHNGFELGEMHPVNTGLDFTEEQIALYSEHNLPLFSNIRLNWNSNLAIIPQMRLLIEIRIKYIDLTKNFKEATFFKFNTNNEKLLCFIRKFDKSILFVCNLSDKENYTEIEIPREINKIISVLDNNNIKLIDNKLKLSMSAFDYNIFELVEFNII